MNWNSIVDKFVKQIATAARPREPTAPPEDVAPAAEELDAFELDLNMLETEAAAGEGVAEDVLHLLEAEAPDVGNVENVGVENVGVENVGDFADATGRIVDAMAWVQLRPTWYEDGRQFFVPLSGEQHVIVFHIDLLAWYLQAYYNEYFDDVGEDVIAGALEALGATEPSESDANAARLLLPLKANCANARYTKRLLAVGVSDLEDKMEMRRRSHHKPARPADDAVANKLRKKVKFCAHADEATCKCSARGGLFTWDTHEYDDDTAPRGCPIWIDPKYVGRGDDKVEDEIDEDSWESYTTGNSQFFGRRHPDGGKHPRVIPPPSPPRKRAKV